MAAVTGSVATEFIRAHQDHCGNKIANIAAPEDPTDAATKQFVDDSVGAARDYVSAAPEDWPIPPATIASALDALAARVQALEAAP